MRGMYRLVQLWPHLDLWPLPWWHRRQTKRIYRPAEAARVYRWPSLRERHQQHGWPFR